MAERISFRQGRLRRVRRAAAALGGLAAFAMAAPDAAWADPPHWAPAHGRATGGSAGTAAGRTDMQLTYSLPPGLQDGRCRPEMFEASAVGGLIGAFAGARFGGSKDPLAATALGTLVGAVAGRQSTGIGRAEEVCFSQSFEHVPDRETVAWMDHTLGAQYSVTPTKTIKSVEGRVCREYTARATVNGQAAGTFGTACRQSDGSWELVN